MKRLKSTALIPPPPKGGFVCRDGKIVKQTGQFWAYVEATDCWVFYGEFYGLVDKVRENLISNQQPVPADLESVVSESICARTPANWKGCKEAERPRLNRISWGQMRRWFKTMLAFSKDRELVPQEEAERRARICLPCVRHVPAAECKTGGCGGSVGGFLTQLAIHRSTPYDEQLGACGVCGCMLSAMAHFPNTTLDKASAGLEYPSDTRKVQDDGPAVPCWRRE